MTMANNSCASCGSDGSACGICGTRAKGPSPEAQAAETSAKIRRYLSEGGLHDASEPIMRSPMSYLQLLTAETKPKPIPFAFVSGFFDDAAPHVGMRLVLDRYPAFKVTTDADLIAMRFQRTVLDDEPPFLAAVRSPSVLVIYMGILLTKNVEASAVIHEATQLRFVEKRPTVIVNEPTRAWGPSHRIYSDAFAKFLKDSFVSVTIQTGKAALQ